MKSVIWQKSKTGCHEVIVTLPTQWQGESDCVVGPFSSHDVAEYFANAVVDFGQFETLQERVFANGDAWYVEVTRYIEAEKIKGWRNNPYNTFAEATRAVHRHSP
jgi:hypothetical protein